MFGYKCTHTNIGNLSIFCQFWWFPELPWLPFAKENLSGGDKEAEKTSDVGDGCHEDSNRTEVNIDTR